MYNIQILETLQNDEKYIIGVKFIQVDDLEVETGFYFKKQYFFKKNRSTTVQAIRDNFQETIVSEILRLHDLDTFVSDRGWSVDDIIYSNGSINIQYKDNRRVEDKLFIEVNVIHFSGIEFLIELEFKHVNDITERINIIISRIYDKYNEYNLSKVTDPVISIGREITHIQLGI